MNSSVLSTLILTGFGIAFLHAAIPSHWLPFVAASQAHKWSVSRTLTVATIAGLGHVFMTAILGVFVVWLGLRLDEKFEQFFPFISGGLLLLLGGFYLRQHVEKRKHRHLLHLGALHEYTHHAERSTRPERLTFWSLFAMLTFSPCEGFLPIYLSAASSGYFGFFILSAVLAVATVSGTILLTWLTLVGFQKYKIQFLEKYESIAIGLIMWALGIFVILSGD